MIKLVIFISTALFSISAIADFSVYTKVNDKKTCQYKETKGDDSGPDSCEYICDGPFAGVKTNV